MKSQIEFEGFEATSALKSRAKEILWNIEGRSPNQASARALIKESAGSYDGSFVITYSAGTLTATSVGATPEESLELLNKDILSKLKDWSKSRVFKEIGI